MCNFLNCYVLMISRNTYPYAKKKKDRFFQPLPKYSLSIVNLSTDFFPALRFSKWRRTTTYSLLLSSLVEPCINKTIMKKLNPKGMKIVSFRCFRQIKPFFINMRVNRGFVLIVPCSSTDTQNCNLGF